MTRCLRTALITSLILLLPTHPWAAPWGRTGHPRITFEAATSAEIALPGDIANVVALGSVAPDYFEFDTMGAHAQTEDPALAAGRLAMTRDEYHERQENAFRRSERWHDFYFDAAVEAMKHGRRERAAFLLGYALHNRQDLGTHRGMPNLVHAAWSRLGRGPDADPQRLASARQLAALDLLRFQQQIGEENWSLFRGKAVRRPGQLAAVVPEPLGALGASLEGWDPRSGIIPSPRWTGQRIQGFISSVQSQIDRLYQLRGDARTGPDKPTSIQGTITDSLLSRIENFALGLYARQDEMLSLLDVTGALGIQRGEDDPEPPEAKDEVAIASFALQGHHFESVLPDLYARLTPADQALLNDLRWEHYLEEGLAQLRELREERRRRLLEALERELRDLRRLRENYRNRDRLLTLRSQELDRERQKWEAQNQRIAGIELPTHDGRPAAPQAARSGSVRESVSPSERSDRSPRARREDSDSGSGRSGRRIDYDVGKWRNPNFDGSRWGR